jgi:hypothetical protein
MLIFLEHRLAFLATPKTGTTAVEGALKPRADIIFSKGRKHMTARRFAGKVAPFLKDTYDAQVETIAVMRDPLEQIRSWYRYRARPRKDGLPHSTAGVSFDDFVSAVISDQPPAYARIGSQYAFLTDGKGNPAVTHLFAYELPVQFLDFLSQRLDQLVVLQNRNVSPMIDTPLSHDVEVALRKARAKDFALYARLRENGGYLRTVTSE